VIALRSSQSAETEKNYETDYDETTKQNENNKSNVDPSTRRSVCVGGAINRGLGHGARE
jgi:hypothetical protein